MTLTDEIKAAQEAIDRARARLKSLEEERKAREYKPERTIAELIHERTCTFNHVDECAWHYEDWNEGGRKELCEVAQNMLKICNPTILVKVLECL